MLIVSKYYFKVVLDFNNYDNNNYKNNNNSNNYNDDNKFYLFLISIVSRPGLVKRIWENYTLHVVKNIIQQTAPSSFHS